MVATESPVQQKPKYKTPCEALVQSGHGLQPKPCGSYDLCKHARPEEKHLAPHGRMRKFQMARSIRGVQIMDDKPFSQPVGINGFTVEINFGAINEQPDEILQALLNAKSKTIVVDVDRAERNPRDLKAGERAPMRTETICDYEIFVIE